MAHISRIELTNYRSFMSASCRLSPLTLVVGRNNSGKTNFLRAFQDFGMALAAPGQRPLVNVLHSQSLATGNDPSNHPGIKLFDSEGGSDLVSYDISEDSGPGLQIGLPIPEIYDFEPRKVGGEENAETPAGVVPRVLPDGRNVTSALRMLMLGDSAMQKRFRLIESQWKQCLPEIEHLHLAPTGPSRLMVQQKALPGSQPVSDLSEGARLMLAMLTLVHQDPPPPLVLLEDFDHKLHARLFSTIVDFLRELTSRPDGPQIVATTHNPYLVDEFKDDPEAVVIVEKRDGQSTLANMYERMRTFLDGEDTANLDMPLGQVLFSGLADAPPLSALPKQKSA